MTGHTRFPIIGHGVVTLDARDRQRVDRLAGRVRREEPRIDSVDEFAPGTRAGSGPGPALHLHDLTAVQFNGKWQGSSIQYRAFALAADGDAVALSIPRIPAFESYCREVLGLGRVDVLHTTAPAPRGTLPGRCRHDADVLHHLVGMASAHRGLTIHPYVGSGDTWALAAAIARLAGVTVSVAAPPPRLTRRVNDKLWFARVVARLLGNRAQPPCREVHSLAILAECVRVLARDSDRIGIKLPVAAGGAGNAVINAAPLRGLSLAALRRVMGDLLTRLGWRRRFPLMVSIWESPVLSSPSAQLWIPEHDAGPPVLEGIFEQHLSGDAGQFTGATPARLPLPWAARLAREAMLLASLFQELGYYGRCSFDTILLGRDLEEAELHWLECNGRWGGVSIPMTLVNRLTGDWAASPFAIASRTEPLGFDFQHVLDLTADRLFRPGAATGLIHVSPGRVDSGEDLSFVAVGRTVDEARRLAARAGTLLDQAGLDAAA